MSDLEKELTVALRDFVSYSMCAQANTAERKMLAERFESLGKKYEPILARLGFSPRQISKVAFDEQVG